MKLTDAQACALYTLAEHGPQDMTEVHGPRGMDGRRKISVQGIMSAPTLARLEQSGLVSVDRGNGSRPVNAVGKAGHARFQLRVSITAAGRAAVNR